MMVGSRCDGNVWAKHILWEVHENKTDWILTSKNTRSTMTFRISKDEAITLDDVKEYVKHKIK